MLIFRGKLKDDNNNKERNLGISIHFKAKNAILVHSHVDVIIFNS